MKILERLIGLAVLMILALVIALHALPGYTQGTAPKPQPARTITDDELKQEIKSGRVCKLVGSHSFRWGRPGEGEFHVFADYHPGISFETCRVCGTVQTTTTRVEIQQTNSIIYP